MGGPDGPLACCHRSYSLALQSKPADCVAGSSVIQVKKVTLRRWRQGRKLGSELLPEHTEAVHKHLFATQTAPALDLLQLNLLPSIIVWHYGICAEKKCVSIQLAPSKTNTTCHSGLSQLSYPPYHMLVCSNTLFTFLLANYLLLSVVCLGAGRSVMGESQPFSN